MPGKSRFLSEEQSTTISTFRQDSFAGGLNTDRPASELSEGELALANNVKCFPKDVMGRPGTTLFKNRTLPGNGTVHDIAFHQSSKKWLLHRGTQLWKSDATMADFWEEVLLIGSAASFAIDLDSNITENRENFIISTTSGIFHVLISDDTTTSLAFQANSAPPNIPLGGSIELSASRNHIYRIIYTYVRLTGTTTDGRITPGSVLEQETGSVNIITADEKDYGVFETVNLIDAGNFLRVFLLQNFSVSTATDELFVSGSYQTGDAIVLTTTGTLPSPLAISTTYYVIRTTGTEMQLATTRANALGGTQIDITTTGTGTHRIGPDIFNNVGDQHTHIGVYMTGDLGSGIIDPETNTGFNPEIYTWVQDVDITTPPAFFDIDITEEELRAREITGGFNLKTRQWKALPSGNIGEVAGGWFFSATSGETVCHYSQINDAKNRGASIGYYNEDLQINRFKDGIQAFIDTGDYVIVCTSNKTYMYRINSFDNLGTLESVFQLTVPARIDDTIGVIDVGTIAQISEGRFIAVCSDASVRIFDTVRWGADLSLDKVKTSEIKKMQNGSISLYWQGAYYLWYRKDSTDTHNTNTLRLAVEDAAGEGWTTYSGDDWVKPPLDAGTVNFIDSNDISRAVVIDFTSLRPYWIETFDAYTGSGLTKTFIDKSDDPGLCALGSTYMYDAMDNDSFDTGLLSKDLGSGATATETQYLEIDESVKGGSGETGEARIITVASIGSGVDWDVSVSITEYQVFASAPSGTDVAWQEIKLAPFASPGDDIEIGELAGDGVYIYIKTHKVSAGVFTFSLHWKVVEGFDTYSATQAIGSLSEELRITLVGTTISWYFGGVLIDSDTDANWGTLPALKASFSSSVQSSVNTTSGARFNYFSVISGSGMPSTCIGTDGFGSDTVTGRSPSSTIKTKEIIGNKESNIKEVQEAHAYLRPSEEVDGFPSTFEVNAKDYVDGSVTANEAVNDVRYDGDIQFFKEAAGRRLQAEFITNSTDFRMTSLDVDFVEKREKAHPLGTTAIGTNADNEDAYIDTELKTDQEVFQEDIAKANTLFWISRYEYTRELSTNVRSDNFKALVAAQDDNPSTESSFARTTGPDGKIGSAIAMFSGGTLGTTITYSDSKLNLSSFRRHIWSFWVMNPPLGTKSIEMTANAQTQSYIQFNDATTLNYAGLGTVTIDAINDGLWHNIWVKNEITTCSVYQNSVLKGSFSFNNIFGGTDVNIIFDQGQTQYADIFLKDDPSGDEEGIFSTDVDALTNYYNDVISNEGRNYLP